MPISSQGGSRFTLPWFRMKQAYPLTVSMAVKSCLALESVNRFISFHTPFPGWNVAKSNASTAGIESVALDDVVKEPVLYAKIDVEGWVRPKVLLALEL